MDQPLPPEHAAAALPNNVAVAIDRDKNSQYAARWAINNLLNNNSQSVVLVHVRKQHQTNGTTPDGDGESIDVDTTRLFKSFRLYCGRKGIKAKGVVLDSNDVAKALVRYINEKVITNIVLGASSRSALQMDCTSQDVGTLVSECAPRFCSVYVIAKDDVQSIRRALVPAANLQTMPSLVSTINSELLEEVRANKDFSSLQSTDIDFLERLTSGFINVSTENIKFDASAETANVETQTSSLTDTETELRRLKLELKQTIGMYNEACKEAVTAKNKVKELNKWKIEEARIFEQARVAEEAAVALANIEKEKCKAAIKAAEKAQKLAQLEAERRKYAELKIKREAEGKAQAIAALSNNDARYRKYTMEEIETATENFSNSLKIGEGGYGPVYQGKIDHTRVAIKILRSGGTQGKKQFKQEIEVLCSMRHPNMVLLLGACPQNGCLVYEYMNYGSLEDRLFRKGNTPPISWRTRFKIAAEIATGLLFLHSAKPEPLVHRDLKPANILLDRNFSCKISDVGLSRLVPAPVADNMTQCRITSAAGTFCYIDPEYQQTGKLVVKSDIYSFGIMLLQIITARPPMGLAHHVEKSIERGTFASMLDPSVPDWPIEEALCFAKLALQCAELKKKDRPDLGSVVLPELNRLREL